MTSRARVRNQFGHHRRAAGRQLVDDRHVEIGEERHGQRARDGRGAHVELVRHDAAAHGFAFLGQRQALAHAEAMLLVDDGQAQPVEFDMVLDQRLRADHQLHAALGHGGGGLAPRLGRQAAGHPGDVHAQRLQPRGELAEVLFGQDFGGRHQRHLGPGRDGLGRGDGRDHGLAAAHVALQQAMHRIRLRQVCGDFPHDALLRASQRTAGFRTAGPPARPARRWAAAARLP